MSESGETRRPSLGVVLLAAGEGARMGGVPKCLIRIDGQPLIQRSLNAMSSVGTSELVVVTGHYADLIEPWVIAPHARIVRNPAPERGQASSVRLGLEALGGTHDAVIVALADQPLVGASELAELLEGFQRRPSGTRVAYPSVGGERGNPVVLAGSLVQQLIGDGKAGAVRKFIDEHPAQVHVLETNNPAFITDLDTRDDVVAFEARTGCKLSLPA